MKTKELCNNVYRDLVARLGELAIQQDLINSQIEEIKHQLNLLNSLSPKLQSLEKELTNLNASQVSEDK